MDDYGREGMFFFTITPRSGMGSTKFPFPWAEGALSLRIKEPQYEADHSPPSRICVAQPPLPHTS